MANYSAGDVKARLLATLIEAEADEEVAVARVMEISREGFHAGALNHLLAAAQALRIAEERAMTIRRALWKLDE